MATAAPTDAPDDTPSTYGSVNGLRNTDWYAAPHTESPAPTSTDNTIRGALRFKKMGEAHISCQLKRTTPTVEQAAMAATSSNASPAAAAAPRPSPLPRALIP